MNEAMKDAWLEISQMLGEPTREELDVFLRTWQRAKQAYSAPVQSCYCPNCEAMGKELAALKAQPAPVQEPVAYRAWVDGWQYTETAGDGEALCLCTPPAAQRPVAEPHKWVGLDDDDISALGLSIAKAKALESLLKKRNT